MLPKMAAAVSSTLIAKNGSCFVMKSDECLSLKCISHNNLIIVCPSSSNYSLYVWATMATYGFIVLIFLRALILGLF